MIWLIVEEPEYIRDIDTLNKRIENLAMKLPKLSSTNTIVIPSIEEINENLKLQNPKIVIDYRLPKDIVTIPYSVFTVIDIKSKNFPFTKEHIEVGIDKATVLAEKLGLRIAKPRVTLDDMAGAETLHKDINKMLNLEEMNIMHITGLFLFGVAGAGKSYFAECFAGSTGRYFVQLDLAYFMSLPNPTKSIDDVFEFLLSQNNKYILLIDEIEKMFKLDGGSADLASDQIFGKMLTWLATIYENKQSNITFVATANRVENLLKYKPEFVRRGRFDRLYFLNYPKIDSSAPAIFDLYLNKKKKNLSIAIKNQYQNFENKENLDSKRLVYIFTQIKKINLNIEVFINKIVHNDKMDTRRMIHIIEGLVGRDKITDSQYFIYSPPEIKSVVKEVFLFYVEELTTKLYDKVYSIEQLQNDEIELTPIHVVLEDIVFKTPPLQITAPDGIGYQLAQAKNIKQGDKISPFIEIS